MSVSLVLSCGKKAPLKSMELYLGAGPYLMHFWTDISGIILQKLWGNLLVTCMMSQHQEMLVPQVISSAE